MIYVISGIGGNLFSSVMSYPSCFINLGTPKCLSVGASTSIMGLLGSMVGFLII